jgi:hypothetical protein
MGHQGRGGAHAGGRGRRLAAGMPASNHNDVESLVHASMFPELPVLRALSIEVKKGDTSSFGTQERERRFTSAAS